MRIQAAKSFEDLVDDFLKPTIELLESHAAISTDQHPNCWIELGCDVQNGDGRLITQAKELLRIAFDEIPQLLKSWLWLQTSEGRVEVSYYYKAFTEYPHNYDPLQHDEIEAYESLFEEILTLMLRLAERAYSRHQHQKLLENEHDEQF
jgi:hypothetical protein